jgi:hypothetical protein
MIYSPKSICVHLSRCLKIVAGGLFSPDRLTFPAPELIQDRGPPTPVGIFAAMHEQRCDFLPAPPRLGSLEVEGLRNRLTGHGQLQGQAPGMQWRLRPRLPLLRWAGLPSVGLGEEGGNHRGDERGMQERFHRAGAFGIDLVQAVDRRSQFDAQFHLPDTMPPNTTVVRR